MLLATEYVAGPDIPAKMAPCIESVEAEHEDAGC